MKKIIKIIMLVLVVGVFVYLSRNNYKDNLKVTSWDNIYNEENIVFFYSNKNDNKIKALNNQYSLSQKVKDEKTDLDKVIKVSEILNDIITFDDVPSLNMINGFDILKDKNGSKKASARDLGIIYRDFLVSLGYDSRVGEFKRTNGSFLKEKSYYVVEYWSQEYNKWIMIDFIDRGYFDREGFPCSSMELLDTDIRNLNYNGKTDRSDYIPMLKKVLYTYTINIDNTTDMSKSNSYITYIKDEDDIAIKFKDSFIPPTIFTENKDLMNKNPMEIAVKEDEKAYIILMKKQEEKDDNNSKDESFIIAGFRNGKIMEEYYIRENNDEFRKINNYSDILLTKGDNKIDLSIDGENVISSIEITIK